MKAEHIYINAQGVPCAPTKEIPEPYASSGIWSAKNIPIGVIESCIPIQESDRMFFYKQVWSGDDRRIDDNAFYPVEPYEFEVEEEDFDIETYKVARIIRPSEPKLVNPKELCQMTNDELMKFNEASEPKAGPSKELYSIAPLEWISIDEGMWEANVMDLHYEVWSNRGGCWVTLSSPRSKKCKDIEDGKQQAFEHCRGILTNYLIKE